MSDRVDGVSLVAGLALTVMGALLWLDQEGSIDLTLGLVGALASAVVGIVLVASGLSDDRRRGGD